MASPQKLSPRLSERANATACAVLMFLCLALTACQRSYVCPKTSGPVTIDGRLNERAWQDAALIERFDIPGNGEPPRHATRARIMWDDRYLYVAFDATDSDMGATRTQRDSDTYKDDVLEVFLLSEPANKRRCNFEINPLGTVRDDYHEPGKRFQTAWNCNAIRIAKRVRGTLNEPTDRDEGWRLEIAIPFACLPTERGGAPEAGDVWRFHLARIDRSESLPEGRQMSSCARMPAPRFHDWTHWAALTFTGH